MAYKRRTAVDFDGTVHPYMGKFTVEIEDVPPVEGAVEALTNLSRDYQIVIFSARVNHDPLGKERIEQYLSKYGVPFDEVTGLKPAAEVYIDDRGITFRGNWAEIPDKVRSFKPWNRT